MRASDPGTVNRTALIQIIVLIFFSTLAAQSVFIN